MRQNTHPLLFLARIFRFAQGTPRINTVFSVCLHQIIRDELLRTLSEKIRVIRA